MITTLVNSNKLKKLLKNIHEKTKRAAVGLGLFLLISADFSENISAATTTVHEVSQAFIYLSNSITFVSKEDYLNDVTGIDYLTINIANSEHHWYCGRCGGRSASTTTKVNIYGYTKKSGAEELIQTYTISGCDGTIPRHATYQLKLTDDIKEKYGYFKIASTLSGAASGSCSCDGSGGYFSNGQGYVTVIAKTFDNPTIQTNGNLSDKTMTEGKSDYIGIINAYFPSGTPNYRWQYSEGDSWISLIDDTGTYKTKSHGTLNLSDDKGGLDFSKSPMIKVYNPEVEMNGLKFRAILLSGTGSNDTTSNTAVLTVKSRDIQRFDSIRFASRYGQVGEKITTEDVISFIEFNNGQVVDADKLIGNDSRIKYYGFINPESSINGLNETQIITGLNDGTISHSEIANDNRLMIKDGVNTFYLKFTYHGTDDKSIFAAVKFEGKDKTAPEFSENIELYEKDGITLYTDGDYGISDAQTSRRLIIKGNIRDSVSSGEDISWAYTLTDTKDINKRITIPVYRKGDSIEVNADCNGKYTLLAEDSSGNSTSRIINVKAYDENDPTMNVTVKALGQTDGGVCTGYDFEIEAHDTERLHKKPYLIKRFDNAEEAGKFVVSALNEGEFSSANNKSVSQRGCYLVIVRDAVGKSVSEIITVPRSGEFIDNTSPEIYISPISIKDAKGELSEYNITASDNNSIKSFVIKNSQGEIAVSENHTHTNECREGNCVLTYHFTPEKEGIYKTIVTDAVGNISTSSISVSVRTVDSIEVTDLPDSMSVNSEINIKGLIDGNRILLKMSDGSTDIYSDNRGLLLECTDSNGKKIDNLLIGYGENTLLFKITINKDKENEKSFEFAKTIIGEDNVAPIPGEFSTSYSEGWDGSLTNDISKSVTLRAAEYEDDGSLKDNLIITWYKDNEEIQKKSSKDGGDTYGPVSGESANGVYKYTITDEKGNFCNSTFEKVIDCWDTTPPTGEVKLLPEGVSESSKARYKQIQIVNASDNRGLAEKPYSFRGNNEASYSVVGSLVAGENGSYEIYIKDACGNVTHLQDISLSGIDSIAPTINGYQIAENDEGKTILHVDATDSDSDGNDNTGTLKYSIDGDNYQDSPDFEIDESGIYTIYVKDETGNITRTSTDYTDRDNPQVNAYQGDNGAGVIIVEASDNIGLSRIVMEDPDGNREILQVYDGASSDTVRKDIGKIGTYTITVADMSGNTASSTVNVESISAACNSSILTGLKITPESYTSGDVTVIAQLLDTNGLSSSPFRWNGNIPTAQPYVIMTDNGTATVEICDRYGNSIVTDSITVSNIDRTSPSMDELVQSDDKNHVIVKVSDTVSGVAQITISGGPYSVEMSAVKLNGEKNPDSIQITLPTNGTYTVRAYDLAGNSCQRQITAEGVTTDVAKEVEKEVIKEKIVKVDNVITEEKIVNRDNVITQNVEVPIPILVPVPTPEYITKYKYLREEGKDTSTYIRGEDTVSNIKETERIENNNNSEVTKDNTITKESDMALAQGSDLATSGERTKDGTYIGPDGYEYYGRVEKGYKNNHPFKFWFKLNAEKIAIAMCVLALLLLILCIFMGSVLMKDYIKEQKDKDLMKKLSNK